jgi:hypothetical protein
MIRTEYLHLGRQCGKTTTMLQQIARYQDDHELVAIITINEREADRVSRMIVSDYWELEIDPSRVVVYSVRTLDRMRGIGRDVGLVVDNWDLIGPDAIDRIYTLPWPLRLVTFTE